MSYDPGVFLYDGPVGTPTVNRGAQVGRDRIVDVQFKDRTGANFSQTTTMFVYSSDTPDGSDTPGDESLSVSSGRLITALNTTTLMVQTNSGNSAFSIKITKPTAGNVYLVIVLPNGVNLVTSVVAFT